MSIRTPSSTSDQKQQALSKFIHLPGLVFLLLLLNACAPSVPLGEEVELHKGDTVAVQGTGLRIRLEDVGHGWYADGRHFPIVFVTIAFEGSTDKYEIEDSLQLGDYVIDVSGTFEPEGRCSIVVTRR